LQLVPITADAAQHEPTSTNALSHTLLFKRMFVPCCGTSVTLVPQHGTNIRLKSDAEIPKTTQQPFGLFLITSIC